MNRRHFLGQVVLGSAAVSVARVPVAAQSSAGLQVKFVGLMCYVSRSDGSVLVALPGPHPMGHYAHVPFVMARAGTPIAKALGLTSMPGVIPGAFDISLVDASAESFVFRCLYGADVEVVASGSGVVDHRANQLAQMRTIASGKRLRQDLRRWAQSTVTLHGGTLDNSAAHPDAGRVWTFGSHRQQLTDATVHRCSSAIVRLSIGGHVFAHAASSDSLSELWVVSAAAPSTAAPNPKRLDHVQMLFEFFSGAEAVIPTCNEAEGRVTYPTELPCSGSKIAALHGGAVRAIPPVTELCPGGGSCCE